MKKNCVIYYSRTDKTRAAAKAVAEKMGADIFKVNNHPHSGWLEHAPRISRMRG